MAIFNLTTNTEYFAAIWGFDGSRWNGAAMAAVDTIIDDDWPSGMVALVGLVNSSGSATGIYTFVAPMGLSKGSYLLLIHATNTVEPAENAVAVMEFTFDGTAEVASTTSVVTSAVDASQTGLDLADGGRLDQILDKVADVAPDHKPTVTEAGEVVLTVDYDAAKTRTSVVVDIDVEDVSVE